MSNNLARWLRVGWSVVMSVLVVLVGILFIYSAIDIYQSGDRPYTPERIAAHFDAISLPVYLCLIWAIGGAILALACPAPEARLKGKIPLAVSLQRLSAKVDLGRTPAELTHRITRERRTRALLRAIGIMLYLIAATAALIYALTPTHFPVENANREVMRGALVVAGCLVLPVVYSALMLLLLPRGMRREQALLKEALLAPPAEQPTAVPTPSALCRRWATVTAFCAQHRQRLLLITRCLIIVIGIACILAGIANGGAANLYQKAKNLCKECVGLG